MYYISKCRLAVLQTVQSTNGRIKNTFAVMIPSPPIKWKLFLYINGMPLHNEASKFIAPSQLNVRDSCAAGIYCLLYNIGLVLRVNSLHFFIIRLRRDESWCRIKNDTEEL